MVRTAGIKFGRHGKIYDYLCPDETIEEGSVVYVEGHDSPYYVYEIKNVKEEESKATKKITGPATENADVTLASRYADITKVKAECIVNSLGTNTNVFGAICSSIVTKADSDEIWQMLKDYPTGNVYDMHVTDAGNLPSGHIIHIVMPYKRDDYHNENLRLAFSKVIDKAIELGYSTIAIPFIGTGANGYLKDDVYEALNDTMFKYQYKPDIKISIISVSFNSTKIKENRNRRITGQPRIMESGISCCESRMNLDYDRFLRRDNYFDLSEDPTLQMDVVCRLIAENYKKKDEFSLDMVFQPIDFLKQYRHDHGYAETDAVTYVFGYYEKDNLKKRYSDVVKNIASGKRELKKFELFRIAMALHLNFTEVIEFMNLCGYSFSPLSQSNIDYIVFDFIVKNNGFRNPDCNPYDYFSECSEYVKNNLVGDEDLGFLK